MKLVLIMKLSWIITFSFLIVLRVDTISLNSGQDRVRVAASLDSELHFEGQYLVWQRVQRWVLQRNNKCLCSSWWPGHTSSGWSDGDWGEGELIESTVGNTSHYVSLGEITFSVREFFCMEYFYLPSIKNAKVLLKICIKNLRIKE